METHNLLDVERCVILAFYEGKSSEEVAKHVNISTVMLGIVMSVIRRKTGAKTWMDLLHLGKQLLEEAPMYQQEDENASESEIPSEVTQERADKIHQMISAMLLQRYITDEEKLFLEAIKAKWYEKSIERWRPIS